jgi:rod shape-determining protein MreC
LKPDVMETVLGRYRNLTILVGVLFLQVLGLAVQVKRSADAEHTRLIRIWVVDAITPLERGLVWAQNCGDSLWHNYFFLRGVRAENRQLKEQIEQMRLEQVRLSEDAAQAHRLQSLLAFKEQVIGKPVAAQVIGSSGSDLSRSIYIDKGSNEGITADMPVITAGGIVGKVLRVYPSTALVLMINDQSSGVGVLLEKSRLQGVLRGTADGELVLERVMSDEQVVPGETVLSSGGDQIFPKGLPVGVVSKVSPGKEMFLSIKVKPAADLGRLEEVLVVTQKKEQAPVAENGGRVRAADILAQRLPSVPDKTAAAAGTGASAAVATGAPSQEANPAKPLPVGASKALTVPGTNSTPATPGITAGGEPAKPGIARSVNVAGHGATGGDLKKAVQTGSTADSSGNAPPGMSRSQTSGSTPGSDAGQSPAKTGSATGQAVSDKPVSSKPVSDKPVTSKPRDAQPTPSSPVTEDNPH